MPAAFGAVDRNLKALPIGRAHSQVEEYIASPTSTPYISKQLVSQASHLSLYFLWEEQNTSAHSGQLSMPQRNVVIAFNSCRSHWQTVTTDRAFRIITVGTCWKELSLECKRSVISPGHSHGFWWLESSRIIHLVALSRSLSCPWSIKPKTKSIL